MGLGFYLQMNTQKQINNGLDFSKIDPKKFQAYSPNLYKYLNKDKIAQYKAEVWIDETGYKWLGYIDDETCFIGEKLNWVLCVGARESSSCYSLLRLGRLSKVDDFWDEYIRIGRCAIDKNHTTNYLNSDSRYIENDNKRVCQWCGHKQYKRRWEETIQREEWVNQIDK